MVPLSDSFCDCGPQQRRARAGGVGVSVLPRLHPTITAIDGKGNVIYDRVGKPHRLAETRAICSDCSIRFTSQPWSEVFSPRPRPTDANQSGVTSENGCEVSLALASTAARGRVFVQRRKTLAQGKTPAMARDVLGQPQRVFGQGRPGYSRRNLLHSSCSSAFRFLPT
jgi:hypothetical protein